MAVAHRCVYDEGHQKNNAALQSEGTLSIPPSTSSHCCASIVRHVFPPWSTTCACGCLEGCVHPPKDSRFSSLFQPNGPGSAPLSTRFHPVQRKRERQAFSLERIHLPGSRPGCRPRYRYVFHRHRNVSTRISIDTVARTDAAAAFGASVRFRGHNVTCACACLPLDVCWSRWKRRTDASCRP